MTVVGRVAELWRYPVKSMAGEQLDRTHIATGGIPGDRGWAVRDEAAGELRGAKKLPALMRCNARYTEEPTADHIPPATFALPDGRELRTTDRDADARLSALLGRKVTLWSVQPPEQRDHYRRGRPDHEDMETELREIFGRLPDEPLPDLSVLPRELFEFTSPLGTHFDAAPIHVLTTASLRALAAHNPSAQFDRRRFRPNILVESVDESAGLIEAGWCGRRLRIGGTVLSIFMRAMRCSMTMRPVADLPADPSVLRTIVCDADQNLGVYATVDEAGPVAVGDRIELV